MAVSNKNKKKLQQLKKANPFISSTELVYMLLRDDIAEHRIKPGQKLNQEQIAEDLDMSRSPVRDAMSMLERDGFISKGAQGYSVYRVKVGDYMALLDLRIAIEKRAAKLACSRIRTSELKALETNLSESENLLQEGRRFGWDDNYNIVNQEKADSIIYALGKLDQQFHQIIIDSCHNKYITNTYNDLVPRIHFFRYFAMDVNCCLNMVDRHRMILNAISARDENLAAEKMDTHLNLTISRAMRY